MGVYKQNVKKSNLALTYKRQQTSIRGYMSPSVKHPRIKGWRSLLFSDFGSLLRKVKLHLLQ